MANADESAGSAADERYDNSATGEGPAAGHGTTAGGSVSGGITGIPMDANRGGTDLTSGGRTSGSYTGRGSTGGTSAGGGGTSGTIGSGELGGGTTGGDLEDSPGGGRDLAADV